MTFALSDEAYKPLIEELSGRGDLLLLGSNPNLRGPESRHADLQLFSAGNTVIASDFLKGRIKTDKEIWYVKISPDYPACCALNALKCGDILFHNIKSTAPEIKNIYPEIINVRQGYTRCNSVYIDPMNLILTSDRGIMRSAPAEGFDAFYAPSEKIELPGYGSGFIGGTMGFVPEINTLFVNGSLSKTFPEIYNILSTKINVFETEGNLADIGSILVF